MSTNAYCDALVLGSGPGALSISAALGNENLKVEVLSKQKPTDPWPFTYGIWGEEVDELGIEELLAHRWKNTVSYFGAGSKENNHFENTPTKHNRDYGLFDKSKLQNYWINQCNKASTTWHIGIAIDFEINNLFSIVKTSDGKVIKTRLIIDATGYNPVFLKSPYQGPIAVQTCYGIVGEFSSPPVEKDQFILMDYRNNHLSNEEKIEPPTFLYAMDMGDGKYFLEETSLGLAPPVSLDLLKARLHRRLKNKGIKVNTLEHEELGIYLPMNMPIPNLNQPILGFGGSAGMVHPASGYMVGSLLRRAPLVAKAVATAMKEKDCPPSLIAKKGWEALWPDELRKKQALYKFGLEKLMRFDDKQLRDFFIQFFQLPNKQWYGFLTNTLSLKDLIKAMWRMFQKAPWNVKWGLMRMQGREMQLLWNFLKVNN